MLPLKQKKLIQNPFIDKPELKPVVYDIESYPNYFLAKFLTTTGKELSITGDQLPYLRQKLNNPQLLLIGFNSVWFDDLILKYIIYHQNINTFQIYEFMSKLINMGNDKPKWFWNIWKLHPTWYRSIDVYKLPEAKGGLKERGCSLHVSTVQDIPILPGTELTEDQKQEIDDYCSNDLHSTLTVYNDVLPDIKNRLELESMYPGTDLISKHDAGVAEEIMLSEYCKRNDIKKWQLKKTIPQPGKKLILAETIPHWVKYHSPELNELLNHVKKMSGVFGTKEQKKAIGYDLVFDGLKYKFGAGGIHSDDESIILQSDNDHHLLEIDVDSFYPGLFKALQIRPAHLNQAFNDIVQEQTEKRLHAKHSGDKKKAKALKIPILSNFGKMGSSYSIMFGELGFLQTTIGGQLSLLMLIEMLTDNGYKILSANTDGVYLKIRKDQLEHLQSVYQEWEKITEQKLSEEFYKVYIRRDINNYIGINMKGEIIKQKGVYKEQIKGKASIIAESVREFYNHGIPVYQTIKACDDIKQFIFYFHANRGFWLKHKRIKNQMIELPATVRWYTSTAVDVRTIQTKDGPGQYFDLIDGIGDLVKFGTMTDTEINAWKVTHKLDNHPNDWIKTENMANGANSKICLKLPTVLPDDINYDYYIKQAEDLLSKIDTPMNHKKHLTLKPKAKLCQKASLKPMLKLKYKK